jgi:hypothetical protein
MNFGNTAIRMKVEDFLTVVEQNTGPVVSILHSVIHAYNPPLDLNTVTQMIQDGPTEELRRIGLPKYLGDVLIDGSQSRIGLYRSGPRDTRRFRTSIREGAARVQSDTLAEIEKEEMSALDSSAMEAPAYRVGASISGQDATVTACIEGIHSD